jgi:uncharacterized protein with HEPN domain
MNELDSLVSERSTIAARQVRLQGKGEITDFRNSIFEASLVTRGLEPIAASEATKVVKTELAARLGGEPVPIENLVRMRDRLVVNRDTVNVIDIVSAELNVLRPRRVGAFGPILATVDSEAARVRRKNPTLAAVLSAVTEEAAFQAARVAREFIPELVESFRDVGKLDPEILTQGLPTRAPDKEYLTGLWNDLLKDGTVDPNNAEDSLFQALDIALDEGEEEDLPDEPLIFPGEPLAKKHYEAGCSFERLDVLQPSFKSFPVYCVTSADDKSVLPVFTFGETGDEYQAVDITYQRYPVESLLTPKDHAESGGRVSEGYKQSLSVDYLEDHFVGIRPKKKIERFQHTTILCELGGEPNLFTFVKEKFEGKKDDFTEKLPKKAGELAEAAANKVIPGTGKLAASGAEALIKVLIDYVLAELFKQDKTDVFSSISVIHTVRVGRNGKPKSEINVALVKKGKDGERETSLQVKPDQVQYDKNGNVIKRADGKVETSRRTEFNNDYVVAFEGVSNDKGLQLPAPVRDLVHGETACLIWTPPGGNRGLHVIVTLINEEKTRKAIVALRAVVRLVPDD